MPSEKYIIPDLDIGHPPEPVEYLYQYWRERSAASTDEYARVDSRRSDLLLWLMQFVNPYPQSVLEVGCNCGRNLYHLQKSGISRLAGIDIRDCTAEVRKHYPELSASFFWGPADLGLKTLPDQSFDLIFTMATLTHIPSPAFEEVAENMARIAKGCIITIEDEYRGWPIHHKRNYREVFSDHNFLQLMSFSNMRVDGVMDSCYVARILSRWEWNHDLATGH